MTNSADYVFLHGGGQGSWVWSETLAALHQQAGGRSVRAQALDIPGCGTKRGRDTSAIGFEQIVAELLTDLSGTGFKDIILVGHSQAGNVLPRLAAARPSLFRRLVYVSCSIPLPGQTVLQMMGTGPQGSNPDEVGWPHDGRVVRERYPRMFCNDMSDARAASFVAKLGDDAWPPQVYTVTDWPDPSLNNTPSTYVICLRDGILPVAWQERFATRFNAQKVVRIDAGHQVMNTRPQALAEVLHHEAT